MVKPDSAVRRLMRDTGKLLQPYGFHHDAGTHWARVEPGGVASVGRSRALRTWTGGQQELRFGLDLDATPTTWWEYRNWCGARQGLSPTPIEKASGPGQLTNHGLPDEVTGMWSLRLDPAQDGQHALQADIEAIRDELPRRVHLYARRALRLVEPGRYLEELLACPNPGIATWEAIVVLLAERGPGPRLDDAVGQLRACCAEQSASDYAEEVAIAFATARAALV
ncbi:hypothetical protein [Nocardia alni]|uniref:hypothetical protein n=1 Tax=Nocardia alni TaxID=2815723 RepID=UPI001C2234B7|nr:hypothetical protein [Nocardia alni]